MAGSSVGILANLLTNPSAEWSRFNMVWSSLRYSTADCVSYAARSADLLLSKESRAIMGFKDDLPGYASIHVDPSTGGRYLVPDPRDRYMATNVSEDREDGTDT